MVRMGKIKLPDTELFILLELAQRAGKSEEEYLVELIREAAWREVVRGKVPFQANGAEPCRA